MTLGEHDEIYSLVPRYSGIILKNMRRYKHTKKFPSFYLQGIKYERRSQEADVSPDQFVSDSTFNGAQELLMFLPHLKLTS